jgi:PAS domain-containing protein
MSKVQTEEAPATGDVQAVAQSQEQIIAAWTDRLQQVWSDNKRHKLDLFFDVIKFQTDALSYLIAQGNPNAIPNSDSIVARTIERIQTKDFDISDLFCEIRYLHEIIDDIAPGSFEESLFAEKDSASIRHTLDDFFEIVARETSVVYEYFAEHGIQALFILDSDGKITYSNSSAQQQLGAAAHEGARFISCLEPEDQIRFDRMLLDFPDDSDPSPICATLKIVGVDSTSRSISVELARLEHTTVRSVYYVSLSPAPKVLGVDDDVLENFDQGIVRVNLDKIVYYANNAARKLMGQDDFDVPFQPVPIHKLFAGEDQAKIDAELLKREHGELSRYEIKMTQVSGRKIPVSICAIPELDAAGNHIGSVAIVRNLMEEQIASDFNECLVDGDSWQKDIERLSSLLFSYVEADVIMVYRYTPDMRRVSLVASLTRDGQEFPVGRRWFPLSDALIEWNRQDGFKRYPDFPEFVKDPVMKELAEDPSIQQMIANGFKSFMATPLMYVGDNIAGLSFIGFEYNQFSQEDENLVSELPISDVVLSAIQRKDREEKTFQFRLMAKLSECTSFADIAHRVTKDLARHYGWDNVSMFDVAEDVGELTMIKQFQGSDVDYVLEDGYHQPSSKGLLGQAVEQKKRIYEPNVKDSKDFYKGHDKIRSELIIPIFSRMYDPPRVFWLLNIEDSHTDFLIDEEIRDLERIAEQIDFAVNRMILRVTFDHAMATSSDGVIVTDANGEMRFVNPASCELLKYEGSTDLIGKNIANIFRDPNKGKTFLRESFRDSYKVDLLRAGNQGTLPVLLSKLELPVEISDMYFVFKSLEAQKRLADLEAIEKLVGDIANQVKTPLSLVHGMLHRLSSNDNSLSRVGIGDFVERSRKLLKKVELTYDRVAYAEPIASNHNKIDTYVYLDRIFTKINEELSNDEDEIIDLRIQGRLGPISGDRHQIRFVCESLVSYLLRNLTRDEKIIVEITDENNNLCLKIHAPAINKVTYATSSDTTDWDRTVSEVTFGQTAIRQIVANHHGTYQDPVIDSDTGTLEFKLSFPASGSTREQ